MTIIERVARAIYEKRNGAGAKAFASLPLAHREPYLSDARAAIEAMREPTKEMCDAAWITASDENGDDHWRAMINSALNEGGEGM